MQAIFSPPHTTRPQPARARVRVAGWMGMARRLALFIVLALGLFGPGVAQATMHSAAQVQLKRIADIQVGDEVLAWDELAAHDLAQRSNQGLQAKQAASPGGTSESSSQIDSTLSATGATSYQKVTDIVSIHRQQTLVHLTLDNGQTLTATQGQASITTPTPGSTNSVPNYGTITSNIRLPGQYEDAETGLHYNYRRYYDTQSGRYVTQDPIGVEGGINQYKYVEADPVNLSDPIGECPMCVTYAVCVASCMLEDAAVNAATGECRPYLRKSTREGAKKE